MIIPNYPICWCVQSRLDEIPRLWLYLSDLFPSLCGQLPHSSSAVVFFDHRHPGSGILISLSLLIINSVVRVVVSLIYLNCLFYPAWVEMGITINKINIVPERVVSGAVGVLWDGGELFISGMDILLMFLDSLLHIFTSFADVSLPARTGNPVEYAIPFGWIDGILRAKLFKEAFDIGQDCGGSELGGGFSASGRCLGFFLSFFLSFFLLSAPKRKDNH